jgi:hypothetical protein
MMMKLWRSVFALAALFNLAVGGSMCAAPLLVAERLGVGGAGAPYAMAMVGLLIAMFGIGYAMVAVNPPGNRGIVWIGMIGKAGAVLIGWLQYSAGALPLSSFSLAAGDVLFVVLFALFLWRGPRPA